MPLELAYFYGGEAEQYSFYRIPKTLFTDCRYEGVSIEAKLLYGLMLDRMGLSVHNGWMDEQQRVYIYGCDPGLIDGYVELMAEVCNSTRASIRVNQEELPTELVRSRFLHLDMTHIAYVQDYLSKNTTTVGNIRAYTLSVLYNAPTTMGQYYASQVGHDMAQA